jgi:hypothetical protein
MMLKMLAVTGSLIVSAVVPPITIFTFSASDMALRIQSNVPVISLNLDTGVYLHNCELNTPPPFDITCDVMSDHTINVLHIQHTERAL